MTTQRIDEICREAKDALENGSGNYRAGLNQAVAIFQEAIKKADNDGTSPKALELIVRKYAELLVEHWQFGPSFVTMAEEYAREDLSIAEKEYGPRHEVTGTAHRTLAKLLLNLDRWGEAAPHFIESAAVIRAVRGDYDAQAGEDISSAAYCYSEQNNHQRALDLNLIAYDISLKYPGNEFIHPQPLCFDIAILYRKLGNEVVCKEWLARYDKYEKANKG